MKYNKIHDRYDLGLGLFFQFKFNHIEYKNKITIISNIPDINLKQLEATNTHSAIIEVIDILRNTITLGYDTEVLDSIPNKQLIKS